MWKWVWVGFLMACRGSGAENPDAAPVPIDANQDPRVDVVVTSRLRTGEPDPTAIVIFADDTGTVIQHGPVDAQGHAQAPLVSGTVTVLQVVIVEPNNPNNVSDVITAIHGVKSQDQLEVGAKKDPLLLTGATDLMTASYTLPAATNNLGFVTACGGGTTNFPIPPTGPATFAFYDSCRTPTFDLYAVHDSTAGQRRYVWQPDIPHVADGAFVIADAWQPIVQSTITITNVPANLAGVGALESIFVGVRPIEIDRASLDLPTAGTHVLPLTIAPGAGRATTFAVAGNAGLFQRSDGFTVVTHGSTADLTVDLAALPIPTVNGVPTQTATTSSWTEDTVGAPDLRVVSWRGSWTDTSKNHQAIWVSIEDPADHTFTTTLSGLPDDYAAEDPTKAAGVVLDGTVIIYFDYDNLSGYDAARPQLTNLVDTNASFVDVDHIVHVSQSRCVSSTHGPC